MEIDKITADAKQEFTIILNNGENLNIKLNYLIRVKGWFMSFTYKEKTYNNLHLVSSTDNIVNQLRNILPFSIKIDTKTGFSPMLIDDFINGNNIFILTDNS